MRLQLTNWCRCCHSSLSAYLPTTPIPHSAFRCCICTYCCSSSSLSVSINRYHSFSLSLFALPTTRPRRSTRSAPPTPTPNPQPPNLSLTLPLTRLHLPMPLVVATRDVQLFLSAPDDRSGPRLKPAGGPVIPSPPPSPKLPANANANANATVNTNVNVNTESNANANALFEAAITGNLRGFLDALSDPTVDVNVLDGSKSRRNVLFCALVGTRSVLSAPLVELLGAKRVISHYTFHSIPSHPVLNTRARVLRSVSLFSRPSSHVQSYLYTSSIHPFLPQMVSPLSPSPARSALSSKLSPFWNARVC